MEPSTGRGEAPCAKPLACRGHPLYTRRTPLPGHAPPHDPHVSGSTYHMVYANVTGRISGQMSSELRLQLECLLQM